MLEARMEEKDYFLEAALYYGKTANRGRTLSFRRFAQAAEAIRFAVEELSPSILNGCKLEIGDEEYFGRAIRPLYDDQAFPLFRRRLASKGNKDTKRVDVSCGDEALRPPTK
jgi:hypothetical protein